MFNILEHNFKAMAFQTELLEASDWDEDECDRVLEIASELIQDLDPPVAGMTIQQHLEIVLLPVLLNRNINEFQAKVIIRYMEHQKNLFNWITSTAREE